jgi:type II restriction enzyme
MDLDLSYYYKQAMASYKSPSQLARKVTEKWASDNLYCPECGRSLDQWPTNTPVYDFY